MKPNTNVHTNTLDAITEDFCLPSAQLKGIIGSFVCEMKRGLLGQKSSLKMIPTYVSRPSGDERGSFIALDLGGTNFRILELSLKGHGRAARPRVMKFTVSKRLMTGKGEALFDFIADCLASFLKKTKVSCAKKTELGFTFSFPVRQTGVASGRLVCWTKGFSAKGVEGKDVVGCLKDALIRKGLFNIEIAALANDTVGTLVACSYADKTCDVGVIIGTGTNACYPEDISKVRRIHGPFPAGREIIINIEWGNFCKLRRTRYDKMLDRASSNPGEQMLEKMVSGMYLGEITRLVLADLEKRGILFSAHNRCLGRKGIFRTEYVSAIAIDKAPRFSITERVLRDIGLRGFRSCDLQMVYEVCKAVSRRGARIAAAAIMGVIGKSDPRFLKKHKVAIDGSVYEKHPFFKVCMEEAFREILGQRSSRIEMALTKDGSGRGAAIIAAVAYKDRNAE
ncbi:MAG: hypothetical protein KBB52_01115 [Candidatus Omnitrophica bacterium]|nr:hypothetical protein [Candidatus Omnitrophota bacterium]